ncbi:phytase [Lysobacter enzymogenes]|uniref:Phytase n=1 Tax=Lysobacter enzymogenes TaxID=69 RepID=A0A3N2RLQ0_LYSEN|nr:phytase [Lysobacter enzymogenes]ROU08395.1 phytase [Lysobacter enzymogenes]
MPKFSALAASLAAVATVAALVSCATPRSARDAADAAPAIVADARPDDNEPDRRAAEAGDPLLARSGIDHHVVAEAFLTASTPEDNIDSPAIWRAPNGRLWLLATAKQGDGLAIYDGDNGERVGRYGRGGAAPGQFRRPNGIAVFGDLAFVVERDNHRVQVLQLSLPPARSAQPGVADARTPRLRPLATFGEGELQQPYGLWVRQSAPGTLEAIVTDAYMAGEDGNGDAIAPPLERLDRRLQRYELALGAGAPRVRRLGAFGDTSAEGAIRVPESVWGDPAHDRLLIAEEDLATGTALREYGLDGRYRGRTIGQGLFKAQAEGIALWQCADGSGYWIATDQYKDRSLFHVFDRASLRHLGAFAGRGVGNTDGVWLQQAGSVRFPDGAFYAVHDDRAVGAFDWRDIARALGLRARCEG